jgi:DNA polymerase-3 subunit gamma/tau
MALVRLCYAAELPSPEDALRALKNGTPLAAPGSGEGAPQRPASGPSSSGGQGLALAEPRAMPAARSEPAPGPRLRRFEDVVALAGERREIGLKSALERDVRLVRFEEGRIEFAPAEGASRTLANDLARRLDDWTGRRWVVAVSSEPGAATLYEQRQAAERERKSDAAGHPLVQAVLAKFPGAQIVDVRQRASAEPEPAATGVGDDGSVIPRPPRSAPASGSPSPSRRGRSP